MIDEKHIQNLLDEAKNVSDAKIAAALDKAARFGGLTYTEVAYLLSTDRFTDRIFKIAGDIKQHIYGNRIVMFAPLYVSDYCVNGCRYCGYNCKSKFTRRRLSMDEIRKEVEILEKMGHKRLALEAGEDPKNCPIEYILECLETIYSMKTKNGEIRRVNVNIAATTVQNYQKLHEAGIGTYILFQETYHRPTYELMHPTGPKSDYDYHLTAFDRAMQAGIDDVGAGVLFGLYDAKFEVLALMMHNAHLEEKYGVGFHTISVPRIRQAKGADLSAVSHMPTDDEFKRIVAIIRLAVPFTGMIISTRESEQMRLQLLKLGISQVSGGSSVNVGGYQAHENSAQQFEVDDRRSADQIIVWLMQNGYIPSFCTACYRSGRTGDRFMQLAKTGNIKNVCLPNALLTLYEYALDYKDQSFQTECVKVIDENIDKIENVKVREHVQVGVEQMKTGERDLFV